MSVRVKVRDLLAGVAALTLLAGNTYAHLPLDSRELESSRRTYGTALEAMGLDVPLPRNYAQSVAGECVDKPRGQLRGLVVYDATYSTISLPPAANGEAAERAGALASVLTARGFDVLRHRDDIAAVSGDDVLVKLQARTNALSVVAGPCATDDKWLPDFAEGRFDE